MRGEKKEERERGKRETTRRERKGSEVRENRGER